MDRSAPYVVMTAQTKLVLEALMATTTPEPASAIANANELRDTTVHYILRTLHRAGWAEFEMEDRVAALQDGRRERRLWSITDTGRTEATKLFDNPRPSNRNWTPAGGGRGL